ncbi:DUF7601 domain-containing protein [Vagococcus elongatus]|uniref:Uncharacterized protein n=1 Tax=Vagococcus elongatus TaxID=180344 RepID=A0A430AP16_9ENTE|nr:FctA domain-containing protein [Vagococcus elongatus]RSU09861.1 hypothetical protein CBF29_10855 [Vagococcus elongatus]
MKKLLGKIVAFASVLSLAFVATETVLAAPGDEGEAPVNDIRLSKTFHTPDKDSVDLKDKTFTFRFKVGGEPGDEKNKPTFTPHGSDVVDDKVVAPTLVIPDLVFTGTDKGTVENGVKTTYKQTDNLFKLLDFKDKPAGVYEYTITEEADTNTLGAGEEIKYDGAEYTLRVYVSRDDKGNPVVDGGTVQGPDGKVDPGPTDPIDPGEGGGDNEVVAANGFNFVNIYTKNAGSPDGEASLVITKEIAGNLKNTADEFTFTINLGQSVLAGDDVYDLVVDGKADPIKVKANGTDVEFTLKGGQNATLKGVSAGVNMTVVETKHGDYKPSHILTLNGDPATEPSSTTEASGLLGENENKAAYTNTWNKTTPTGVILKNMPYVMLMLVSLGGFAFYVVSKKRREV